MIKAGSITTESITAEPTNTVVEPWPWQRAAWAQLMEQLNQQRLPHALLIQGMQGLGQSYLIDLLVQRLLCLSPVDQLPCQQCSACVQIKQLTHPDYLLIEREEKSRQLKIEQIREAIAFVQSKSQGWRIVVIDAADTMNANAQNALLKSLEEPGKAALFILINYRNQGLLPTVLSRCQVVTLLPATLEQLKEWWPHYQASAAQEAAQQAVWDYFAIESQPISAMPSDQQLAEWLQAAQGAPLLAWQWRYPARIAAHQKLYQSLQGVRARTQGIASVVELLNHWPLSEALQALISFTQQCLQQRLIASTHEKPQFLCAFYQRLLANWQRCQQGVAINETLLWESLILCWAQQNV